MSSKKWSMSTLTFICVLLLVIGTLTAVIDPFFHYHAPLEGLAYPLNYERYINAGIMKHFDYNAIITGTSMTQNFKTSEFDTLFQANSIKVPFSGASYKEVNDRLVCAIAANPKIQYVLRSLDFADDNEFIVGKDHVNYTEYPEYLYDNNLWNDVSYIFNKSILINNTLNVLSYTKNGGTTYTFDKYDNWMSLYSFGRDAVYQSYGHHTERKDPVPLTDTDKEKLEENISYNVTALIEANPEMAG